jgi:short-subunit dehydrogenase
VERELGPLAVVVTAAGVQRTGASEAVAERDWTLVLEVNLTGTWNVIQAALPGMLARKSGHIVVISSLMGYLDTPLRSGYAASKHALHGYFDSLRTEVWRDDIKVTIVCPGFVKSNISFNALAADGRKHGQMDDVQASGMPADVCAAKTLDAIARGKQEVMIGGKEVLAVYIKRFLPSLYSKIVRKVIKTSG